MAQKKLSPAGCSPKARRVLSEQIKRNRPIPNTDNSTVDEYWLRVCDDGNERRYPYEPEERTLHVIVQNGVETTKTWSIERQLGALSEFIPVCPRGGGWVLADDIHDKWTEWQRKAVRT